MRLPLVIVLALGFNVGLDGKVTFRAQIADGSAPASRICFIREDDGVELGCDDAGPFEPGEIGTVQLALQDHMGLVLRPPRVRAVAYNHAGTSPLSAEVYAFEPPSCGGG